MIYIPLIGSILEASGIILQKKILKNKFINFKNYVLLEFFSIVLIMLPFIYFFWNILPQAYELKNLLLFALVIVFSVIANLLTVYALKKQQVSKIEPIRLMQPLFTVLLAVIIYTSERKFSIFILALIASATLIATHIKKHHLNIDKYAIAALLGSFFFAAELVVSKSILPFYSLPTFYFARCLSIFLIMLLILKPKTENIKNTPKILALIVGAIFVVLRIVLYYGYRVYGVVFTTMLFILAPVFIFFFARIFLKEKITIREIIASIVVIICVVVALLIQ